MTSQFEVRAGRTSVGTDSFRDRNALQTDDPCELVCLLSPLFRCTLFRESTDSFDSSSFSAVVSHADAPAFLGNAPPVYEPIVALGVPASVVQGGSLLLTPGLVTAVTHRACERAVTRFQAYQIG
jgi:hypothetical protein